MASDNNDLLFFAVPSLTALSPGLSEAAAGGQVAAVAGEGTQPSSWDGGLAGAAGSSPPGLHTAEDSGLHSYKSSGHRPTFLQEQSMKPQS